MKAEQLRTRFPNVKWKVSNLGTAEEKHGLIHQDQISIIKILQAKPTATVNNLRNSPASLLLPAFQGGLNFK